MPADNHYDVVIIGSGAGGGTLAWKLAPSGHRVLLARARRLPAEGAGQLGDDCGLPAGEVPDDRDVAGRRLGRRVHPRAELLRRRQHQVLRGRPVPSAPGGLRGDPSPRWHLAELAARLHRLRTVVRRGRGAVHGARRGGRGPDRRAAGADRSPIPRCGTSRGSSSSTTISSGSGCTRRTCRSASCSTRTATVRPSTEAAASDVTVSTGSPASSRERPTPRPCASIPRWHPTRTSSC